MTLRDFKSEIAGLRLHDLASVNVVAVTTAPSGVLLEFDQTEEDELRESVAELEKEVAELEKEVAKLEGEITDDALEIDKANELLDEVKNESEPGATLRDYIKRAEDADTLCKAWREQAGRCEHETLMLRKRKGIDAGYFAAQSQVLALLGALAGDAQYGERAKAIIQAIKSA